MTAPTTHTSTKQTADELIADLRRQGATAVPPSRDASRDAAVDAAGARQMRCRACRRRGLNWTALWLRGGYVAVCACPHCGDAHLA